MERVLGAAADRAGLAVAQLGAQFFDAGVARQALAFQQLAGQVNACSAASSSALAGACADQLLALLHGLLLPFAQGVQLLAQLQFTAMQA
jgi:hypothetical protein